MLSVNSDKLIINFQYLLINVSVKLYINRMKNQQEHHGLHYFLFAKTNGGTSTEVTIKVNAYTESKLLRSIKMINTFKTVIKLVLDKSCSNIYK